MTNEALQRVRNWLEGGCSSWGVPMTDLWKMPDTIEALNALIADTAEHWMTLQFKHPIQWEGAIDSAMAAACAEIEALQARVKVLEEALTQIKAQDKKDDGGWCLNYATQVESWYPKIVLGPFGKIAEAALKETER